MFMPRQFIQLVSLSRLGADTNINANHSGAAAYYEVGTKDFDVLITDLYIRITDATALTASNLFGAVASLTNGVSIKHVRGTGASATVIHNLTPEPVKQLSHWAKYTHDIKVLNPTLGATLDTTMVHIKIPGYGYFLKAQQGDGVQVVVNDDVSGLDEFNVTCMGLIHRNAFSDNLG